MIVYKVGDILKKSKRKKKYTVKTKSRMFVIFLIFGVIISTLGYHLFTNLYKVNQLKKEKKQLEKQLVSLNDEKEILEADIERLSDPDYIAKYVREKYLYSKDGELIIRMDD